MGWVGVWRANTDTRPWSTVVPCESLRNRITELMVSVLVTQSCRWVLLLLMRRTTASLRWGARLLATGNLTFSVSGRDVGTITTNKVGKKFGTRDQFYHFEITFDPPFSRSLLTSVCTRPVLTANAIASPSLLSGLFSKDRPSLSRPWLTLSKNIASIAATCASGLRYSFTARSMI